MNISPKSLSCQRTFALAVAAVLAFGAAPRSEAVSTQDWETVTEVFDRVMDFGDQIDKGVSALSGLPIELDDEKFENLINFQHALERESIPEFRPSVEVDGREIISVDADARAHGLAKLRTYHAEQSAYLAMLRQRSDDYAAIARKSSAIESRVHDFSRVLDRLVDNPIITGLDSITGQHLIYSLLDIELHLKPVVSDIRTVASDLAERYGKEAASTQVKISNYEANLHLLEKMDQALEKQARRASAPNPPTNVTVSSLTMEQSRDDAAKVRRDREQVRSVEAARQALEQVQRVQQTQDALRQAQEMAAQAESARRAADAVESARRAAQQAELIRQAQEQEEALRRMNQYPVPIALP